MLGPLDVYVLLKICAKQGSPWTQSDLANELHISQSQVNRALKTAQALNLYAPKRKAVNSKELCRALIYGAKYFLAGEHGSEARGTPTSWAAPPLNELIVGADPIPVWSDVEGSSRGICLEPLHPSAPIAARRDLKFYELLALVDALRYGRARESRLATKELSKRLG